MHGPCAKRRDCGRVKRVASSRPPPLSRLLGRHWTKACLVSSLEMESSHVQQNFKTMS